MVDKGKTVIDDDLAEHTSDDDVNDEDNYSSEEGMSPGNQVLDLPC